MTDRSANRLDPVPDVLELDVNKPEDIEAVAAELKRALGARRRRAARDRLRAGGRASAATSSTRRRRARSTAFTTSAFSLKALTVGLSDLFPEEGAAIVGLDFDAPVAWPVYDWMGVAKAALEATARYLARDLGPPRVRVQPREPPARWHTLAAQGIPGFSDLADGLGKQAPLRLGRRRTPRPSPDDASSPCSATRPARSPAEIVHVDGGGFHAMGTHDRADP